eukprot:4399954-Amphidinium_carterae.2
MGWRLGQHWGPSGVSVYVITEGCIEGAQIGSWCDWTHRMFKEASAEECQMELKERGCWCCERQWASRAADSRGS